MRGEASSNTGQSSSSSGGGGKSEVVGVTHEFVFDSVMDPSVTQQNVFEVVGRPAVEGSRDPLSICT